MAKLIEGLNVQTFHPVLPQSVHNELIRDQRFVLIGRGTYALKEWGYEPGVVKESNCKGVESVQETVIKTRNY